MHSGDHENRGYSERSLILKELNYDPNVDLQVNEIGCYEFTESAKNKLLEDRIKSYFDSRKEDG